MARRVAKAGAPVTIYFEGREIAAQPGESVAAALFAAGIHTLRTTPVGARPRGPFCMMGVCFDCLVEIDGIGNRQACMEPVRAGMRIALQDGAFDAAAALAAASAPDASGDDP